MTTEWKDITDTEELFRLKREGWEIEYFHPTYPEYGGANPYCFETPSECAEAIRARGDTNNGL